MTYSRLSWVTLHPHVLIIFLVALHTSHFILVYLESLTYSRIFWVTSHTHALSISRVTSHTSHFILAYLEPRDILTYILSHVTYSRLEYISSHVTLDVSWVTSHFLFSRTVFTLNIVLEKNTLMFESECSRGLLNAQDCWVCEFVINVECGFEKNALMFESECSRGFLNPRTCWVCGECRMWFWERSTYVRSHKVHRQSRASESTNLLSSWRM